MIKIDINIRYIMINNIEIVYTSIRKHLKIQ